MKNSIVASVHIVLFFFLMACNPPEEASIVKEDSDPISDVDDMDDKDDGDDSGDDTPVDSDTEYTAHIFFIDKNRLYGVKDFFFETDRQGIGEMNEAFLDVALPFDAQIENQSTPYLFMANSEAVASMDNLRLAAASTEGTLAVYGIADGDAQNWTEVWRAQLGGGLFSCPIAIGQGPMRYLIAADVNGAVHGLDANTGNELWSYVNTTASPSFIAPPEIVLEGGALTVVASFGGYVFGLDSQNGNELWRFNTGGLITAKPYHHKNAPDGIESVVIATQEGEVFRINTTNGELIWSSTLPPDRFSSTSTQFISSAPSSDGTDTGFFIASANRTVFNMDIITGAILWDTGEVMLDSFRSSIAALDSSFAAGIGSFGTLYQFTRNGTNFDQVSWSELQLPNANEGGISGSPVVVESGASGYGKNRMYVKTAIGLYGIDQGENTIASRFEFGSGMGNSTSSPIAIGTDTATGDFQVFYPPNIDDDNQN